MGLKRLTPRFVERVWGSTKLGPLFPDASVRIGEVWFEGIENLPVLVKFIFTTEKLSVQVHPGDEYARVHANSAGKTEMWHILRADPAAQVAAGFREPISKARLQDAALTGEIMDLLEWHDARPGDTFFIPAGTVHAIGEGLMLCEIQQQSDVTYRLYDYGRGRELHLAAGLDVSDCGLADPRRSARDGVLVSCPYFTTSKLRLDGILQHQPSGRMELWIVLDGSMTLAGQRANPGEVWYAPADVPAYELTGNASLLHVRT